jgi:replicative DNA helicase
MTVSTGSQGRDWRLVQRMFDQLPPHCIEAEMSLLGSVFIDPQCLSPIRSIVKAGSYFFRPSNGAIYDHMLKTAGSHDGIMDIVLLNQSLLDSHILDFIGGTDYLVQLAQAVPSATNARHYAQIVARTHAARSAIACFGDGLYEMYQRPADVVKILRGVIGTLNGILPRGAEFDLNRNGRSK